MAGFLVRVGQTGSIMHSSMKKAQLIGEITALREKIAELERTQAERKRAERE
jgi:hypothetical protein